MHNTAKQKLDYYFDYLSPYAYFSWFDFKKLLNKYQLDIKLHPIAYPTVTNAWGRANASKYGNS